MQNRSVVFYGWRIVAATFVLLFVGLASGFYTISVFLEPIQQTSGWSRTQISLGFTIAALLVGFLSPLAGMAVARLGVKKVQLFGALVVGTGLFLAGFIQTLWQYYSIYAFIALGLTSLGPVTSQTIISHWFTKRRGAAMGMIMTGMGLGGMVMVFIASVMNDAYGWRWTYRLLGVLVLGIVVPVILIVIRNKPDELGLFPDGIEDSGSKVSVSKTLQAFTVKEAFGTLPFKLLCLIIVFFNIILGGLTMHSIALLRNYGVDHANTMWSLTLGASVLGRIMFGFLSDKTSKKHLLGVCWLFHIMSFGSVMMIADMSWFVWGFVISYGLALGAFVTLLPLFIGERFGVEHFSKLIGISGLFQVVGLATGSLLLGKIYDTTASYSNAVTLLFILSIAALIVTAFIGQPRRQPLTKPVT